VSEPTGPVPQRIGDAERDRAAEYLRDHMAAGRLDQQEFDDRLNTALTARTSDELSPLFSDLPDPKPGAELVAPTAPTYSAPTPAAAPALPPARADDRLRFPLAVLSAVLWPAVLIAWLGFGIGGWWLIFLPIAVSSVAGKLGYDRHEHRDRDRHQRRLDRGE
jgi:hypothetical protein